MFSEGSAVKENENWVEQLSENLNGVCVKHELRIAILGRHACVLLTS